MNSKYVFFTYLPLGLLLFCSPTHSMEAEKMDGAIANVASRKNLKKIVKEYIVFEENNLTNIKILKRDTDKNDHIRKGTLKEAKKIINYNLEQSNKTLQYSKDYKKGKYTAEECFTHFLKNRMNYLNARIDQLASQSSLFDAAPKKGRLVHTAPEYKKEYKDNPTNLFAYRTSVDRYQFFNRLILCLYPDINANKLTREGRDLLRASITLHPILKGETEDLGYPDMASGYGSITSEYVDKVKHLKDMDAKKLLALEDSLEPARVDVNYYKYHFSILSAWKECFLPGTSFKTVTNLSPFEAGTMSKKLPLPELEWLPRPAKKPKPTKKLDSKLSEDVLQSFMPPHLQPKKQPKRKNNNQKKQPQSKSRGQLQPRKVPQSAKAPDLKTIVTSQSITPQEEKKAPSRLQQKSNKQNKEAPIEVKQEASLKQPTSHINEGEKEFKEEQPETLISQSKTAIQSEKPQPTQAMSPSSPEDNVQINSTLGTSNKSSKKSRPQKDNNSFAKGKSASQKEKEHLTASVPKAFKLSDFLKGNHLETFLSINRNEGKITFEDFKQLWQSLGGTLKSLGRGGSHRTLLYKGKKLGSTYRPHPVPTYSFKSRKFLKQALTNMEDAKSRE